MFSKKFDPGLALLFCLNVHNHMDAMVRPSENDENWRTGPGWRSGLPKTMADGGQDQDGASRGSDVKVGGSCHTLFVAITGSSRICQSAVFQPPALEVE